MHGPAQDSGHARSSPQFGKHVGLEGSLLSTGIGSLQPDKPNRPDICRDTHIEINSYVPLSIYFSFSIR